MAKVNRFELNVIERDEYVLSFRVLKTGHWHSEIIIAKDEKDARIKAIEKHGLLEFLWVI